MKTISLDQVREKIVGALPVRVRWHVRSDWQGLDGPLDFDFSRAGRALGPIDDTDTNGFEIPQEWLSLFVFGEQDYAEGGGAAAFLGVHGHTGQVFGLDVEREVSPLYLLNSDVDRFVATFAIFDRALRQGTLPVGQVGGLAEEIDPAAFAVGEWRDLAEAVASDEDAEAGGTE